MDPVERLVSLTSEAPSAMGPGVSEWMSELRMQLQSFLDQLAADELVADLMRLTAGRRPDLVPVVRRLESCEAILLAQIWDVTYLLHQLGDHAEESYDWLRSRVQSLLTDRSNLEAACAKVVLDLGQYDLASDT